MHKLVYSNLDELVYSNLDDKLWSYNDAMSFAIHWSRNVAILTKFSSLAPPEVVKMTTSSAASDENSMEVMTFFLFGITFSNAIISVDCFLHYSYNERDCVSNHWRIDCLLNSLLRHRPKRKTSKLRFAGLCEGNPPVTGGLSSQRPSRYFPKTFCIHMWYVQCHPLALFLDHCILKWFLYKTCDCHWWSLE